MARRDMVFSAWKAWSEAEKLSREGARLHSATRCIPPEALRALRSREQLARSEFTKILDTRDYRQLVAE